MAEAKIPTEEPGLVKKAKLSYEETLKLACAQADLIHIDDPGHQDPRPFSSLGSDAALKALAEGGVTHMFLEIRMNFQKHVDDLASGKTDIKQFVTAMQKEGAIGERISTPEKIAFLGDVILRSKKLGIDVHCADPGKGTAEMVISGFATMLDGKTPAEVKQFARNVFAGLPTALPALKEEVLPKLLGKTPQQMQQFWKDLEADPSSEIVGKHAAEFEKACLALTAPGVLREKAREATFARMDDKDLAEFVSKTLNGEKGVMFYGLYHGSRPQDFDEHLGSLGVSSLKFEVCPDRKSYEMVIRILRTLNADDGLDGGADKPELVYIHSERTVFTTVETPEALTKALDEKAKLQPLTDADKFPGFDPVADEKILNPPKVEGAKP